MSEPDLSDLRGLMNAGGFLRTLFRAHLLRSLSE